jgi:UDP-glucuronate 4-epimerase
LPERVLVTGIFGCLGAWTAQALLAEGDEVVGYDLGEDRARLRLVLGDERAEAVLVVRGDVTDLEALEHALDEHDVTRVVHLAALQVPFVRAAPQLGMRANVVGTVTVLEAVRRRRERIPGLTYASSAAVYHAGDPNPAPERGGSSPATLYGVSKLADEGMARVYRHEHGLGSIGLRPYVVYGPARDQGMTAGPSLAIAAALEGEPYEIGFSGSAQYDFAPDVGRAFAMACHAAADRQEVYNFPGAVASIDDVMGAIADAVPGAKVTCAGGSLPFPPALEAVGFERDVGPLPRTTLAQGVARTAAHLRSVGPP